MLGTELCYMGKIHAWHRAVLNGTDSLAQSCVKWERHAWDRAVLNGRDMLGTELF